MRKRTNVILMVGLTMALVRATALADTPGPAPLSLDGAIALALQRNPGYNIAHVDIVASRARLREVTSSRLPTVVIRDGLTYANPVAKLSTPFGTLPFSTTTTTNVPLVELQYQVSDGGRTAARYSQAAAALAASDAQERSARMLLIDTTTKAYFDVVAATQSAAVDRRAVTVAQAHVHDARVRFAAGQVPHAEILRAETELANQRVQSLTSESAVELAQTTLDHAIGAPLGEVHQLTDPLDTATPDIDLNTLLAGVSTKRGEILAAQASVDAAVFALKEVRAAHAPQLSALLSDGNVQPAVAPGYRNQVSIGLNAVWTLFDNGLTARHVDEAQAGIDRAKLTLDQLRGDVDLQVRQAYLQLVEAKARAGASRSYVALADENLRLAQVRYRGGVGTVLELQDAELRATTARQMLIAAQLAVREGSVHVRFTAGDDTP